MTASQTSGSNPEGAWSYGTSFPSVGGTATWATRGNSQAATAYALTTPVLTVQANGQVTGSFLHRFSFESNFDGGLLTYAVNGGSFNRVASSLLTGQMYNGATGAGTPIGFGVAVFTGTSSGYATPAYVTTGFTLGTGAAQTFAAGDSIQFQFLDEFDGGVVGSSPNWQIATLNFNNLVGPRIGQSRPDRSADGCLVDSPATLRRLRMISRAAHEVSGPLCPLTSCAALFFSHLRLPTSGMR